jgi:hypothetical protein
MLTGVAGSVAGTVSPGPGDVLDIPDAEARKWADGVRAELVDEKKQPQKRSAGQRETASVQAPERAVPPASKPKQAGATETREK